MKLAQKIREEEGSGCVEATQSSKLDFIETLRTMPIAICTTKANEQHYEVPAELYHLWLGPRKKYSGCVYPEDWRSIMSDDLTLRRHWHVNGRHYQLTSEAWLQNMDRHASRVRELLRQTYPPGTEEAWFNRWRAFFMACAELFGYREAWKKRRCIKELDDIATVEIQRRPLSDFWSGICVGIIIGVWAGVNYGPTLNRRFRTSLTLGPKNSPERDDLWRCRCSSGCSFAIREYIKMSSTSSTDRLLDCSSTD
eukprot:g23988.t1